MLSPSVVPARVLARPLSLPTVNGSDTSAVRVVLEHGNISECMRIDGVRKGAIYDRERVVLDLGAVDTQAGDVRGEVWGICKCPDKSYGVSEGECSSVALSCFRSIS